MPSLTDVITLVCVSLGALFMFIGALGLIRLPDIYMRMSASTKSSTLGVGFILIGVAVYFFDDLGVTARALATLVFILLTAPVGAHMLGRAAYVRGEPLWKKVIVTDDLKKYYDQPTSQSAGKSAPKPTPKKSKKK